MQTSPEAFPWTGTLVGSAEARIISLSIWRDVMYGAMPIALYTWAYAAIFLLGVQPICSIPKSISKYHASKGHDKRGWSWGVLWLFTAPAAIMKANPLGAELAGRALSSQSRNDRAAKFPPSILGLLCCEIRNNSQRAMCQNG